MMNDRIARKFGRLMSITAVLSVAATLAFLTVSLIPSMPRAAAAAGDMTLTVTTPTANTVVAMPIGGTVTGTVTINWGDSNTSTVSTAGNFAHTYAASGTYTIVIGGTFSRFGNCAGYTGAGLITAVTDWGNNGTSSFQCAFLNATALVSVPSTLPVSTPITNAARMFDGAFAFNSDISGWNTSSITTMYAMFSGTFYFNRNIGSWNVSNVTDMTNMFVGAVAFNQSLNTWDVSNVTNMSYMFNAAYSFNGDLSGWNTSNVTDMTAMFNNSPAFNQNIGTWDVSGVTAMSQMFLGATSFNRDLSSWDVSHVATMSRMFSGASAFNRNLGNWDISNVTNMSYMLDNSGLNTTNYSNTIIGWAAGAPRTNVSLGANSLTYDNSAVSARALLTGTKNWTITGDSYLPPTPPSSSTSTSTSVPSAIDPSAQIVPMFAG